MFIIFGKTHIFLIPDYNKIIAKNKMLVLVLHLFVILHLLGNKNKVS